MADLDTWSIGAETKLEICWTSCNMVVTNEEAKANDPKRTSFNRKRGGYASGIVC